MLLLVFVLVNIPIDMKLYEWMGGGMYRAMDGALISRWMDVYVE